MKRISKENIMVTEAISDWQEHHMSETLNLSANAIRSYRTGLGMYLDYLESERGISRETLSGECFGMDAVEKWLVWLKETKGCSPSTCNQRMAALRSFMSLLSRKNAMFIKYGCEVAAIKRMRTAKKLPKTISRDVIKALFASIDVTSMTGKRDFALFNLMYSTATRINEILSLRISDVELDSHNPHIKVIGKGSKPRCIYLLKSVAKILCHYICLFHGDNPQSNGYLFYPIHGSRDKKITQEAVSKRLKIYASCSPSIPDGFHCHSLRHARATHWLEDGVNLAQIQRLLGHESMETTMKYVGISRDQMVKALSIMEDATTKNIKKKYKTAIAKKSLAAAFGLK
ncbi:MAG: tyrosine-type recombinase/integrase [Muribaculum sp.]|nr:tyrosine-type recombinase/integrase [Muribaculum sp.]